MRIIVGSTCFFNVYPDFKPKDLDVLILEENPVDYKNHMEAHLRNKCVFMWRDMDKKEFLDYMLKNNMGMEVGKFLVPEFIEHIGLTIEDLKTLKPLFDGIDEKHTYERVIFDSYISNGEFTLTDEQRLKAYEEYNRKRKLEV